MKRTVLLAAAIAALPRALAAQEPQEPHLVLTVSAGVMSGTDLWHLPAQVVPSAVGGQTDTIHIGRRLGSGLTVSASGIYFKSPSVGYTFEVAYYGISGEGECGALGTFKVSGSPAAENPPANARACTATQGGKFPTSVVAFQTGITYRLIPAGTVSPYLRALAGIGALSNSFVETTPVIVAPQTCANFGTTDCPYTLLAARSNPSLTWVGTLAVGNTFRIGPAYNARLELRDVITSLPFASDSGTYLGVATAQTGWRIRHMVNLTLGFDIVLERSHRRRY